MEELKEWEIVPNPELNQQAKDIPATYVYEDDLPLPTSEERAEAEETP